MSTVERPVKARTSVEERLDALGRDAPPALVAKELESKTALVVGAAARLVKELELADLVPQLAPAFFRFAGREDPNCSAKNAIAEALIHFEADAAEVYLRGIELVQWEPVWGGRVDVGAPLRALSAAGLARAHHPDAAHLIAALLADPEATARAGAATAFGDLGDPQAGAPVLRYKVLAGDASADVLRECMASLLHLDAPRHLPFVIAQLDGADLRPEAAALALGGSKRPEALAPLAAFAADRRLALLAIAMLRSDEAIDYLVSRLGAGDPNEVRAARAALAIHEHDPRVRGRVEAATNMVTVYHYPNCSTCKKALRWLADHGVAHRPVDIVDSPPSARELRELHARSGLPVARFFNTSGESYRKGGFKDRLPSMTDAQAFDALAADGKLIKRPLLVAPGAVLVGFDEAAYQRISKTT